MGVTYLLDTHVVAWLIGHRARVPDEVLDELARQENVVLVSAVSAMEAATKVRLGKWSLTALVSSWETSVREAGMTEIHLETGDSLLAGSMSWEHKDPFDRMLAAQSIRRDAVLVTVDRALLGLPTLRTLSW